MRKMATKFVLYCTYINIYLFICENEKKLVLHLFQMRQQREKREIKIINATFRFGSVFCFV